MNLKKRFQSLPLSTQKLMGLGIVLGLFVALPLFIWSLINVTFDVREKASQETPEIDITNEPRLGLETAPVTIVAFMDFQCPFCKAFVDNTLSLILSNYPYQVKFIFKDFPVTTVHPLAEKAAIAAQCAFNQNMFWEMHNMIFEKQETLTEEDFGVFAATLSLDLNLFDDCYQNQSPLNEINTDKTEGQNLGVVGTPTFFVNGTKVEGAQPFEIFKNIIDEKLVDDVFFKPSGNSVSILTTGQNPNISVDPRNIENGKTYQITINYSLQNNIKYPQATTSAIPAIVLINNVFKSSSNIPYLSIAAHQDGYSESQTTSFTATGTATNIKVVYDPNDILPETNNDNNTLEFNFERVANPTPTATSTATATPASGIGGFVEGEPNSCGGTCGSNYNCKANLYCYKGFCRNPICSENTDCNCTAAPTKTATPTAKAMTSSTAKLITAAPTSQSKGAFVGSASSSSQYQTKATSTPNYGTIKDNMTYDNSAFENEEKDISVTKNQWLADFSKYIIYVGAGIFVFVVILLISKMRKSQKDKIPHIVPPQNI